MTLFCALSNDIGNINSNLDGIELTLTDFNIIKPNIEDYVFHASNISSESTVSGVTYVIDRDNYSVSANGTSTASISVKPFVGTSTSVPSYFILGKTYECHFETTDTNIQLDCWCKLSDNTTKTIVTNTSPLIFTVPIDTIALSVRLRVLKNVSVNGVISNITFKTKITPNISPTNSTKDRTPEILARLNSFGYCNLDAGEYYISTIQMPNYSAIYGKGQNTILHLIEQEETDDIYSIVMGNGCTLSDIYITGNTANTEITLPNNIGKRHGVLFEDSGGTIETTRIRGNVKGLYISGFTGCAIKCYNTGYSSSANANWCNIWIWNCYIGINIEFFSEYHHFANFNISRCEIGIVNNGGNNIFSCGSLTSNNNGYMMDNSSGNMTNIGHGSMVGCNINHNNDGNGWSTYINNVGSGFLFHACHISQGKMQIIKSGCVTYDGCYFGTYSSITIQDSWGVTYNNCFSSLSSPNNPGITVQNSPRVMFINCASAGGTLWGVSDPSIKSINNVITSRTNLSVSIGENGVIYPAGYIESNTKRAIPSWSTTNLIDVQGYGIIEYTGLVEDWGTAYSVWFNENNEPIDYFNQKSGDNKIYVPTGAKYLSFSAKTTDLNPMKLIVTGCVVQDINKVIESLINN